MDKSTVIAKLREHEPELKAAGIVRLSLFGSVARGDASSESDVDLMAEFDTSRQLSLLDMVGLESRLADILAICKQYNVVCGHPHVNTGNVEQLIEQGFRFLMPGVVPSFTALEKGLKVSGRAK